MTNENSAVTESLRDSAFGTVVVVHSSAFDPFSNSFGTVPFFSKRRRMDTQHSIRVGACDVVLVVSVFDRMSWSRPVTDRRRKSGKRFGKTRKTPKTKRNVNIYTNLTSVQLIGYSRQIQARIILYYYIKY